jgi:hypothetical protein
MKRMCGKSFKKVDHIDCKIIEFEVKKRVFFTTCKTSSTNFESSWLNTFVLHKVEAFNIELNKIELKIHQKKRSIKSLFSFFKGSSNRRRYVIRGKN